METFCVKEIKNNVGYMGRSNPWGNLDQLSLVAPHMVDVITCAIFGDYRLRGVGVVKRFAFSHWLDASPLQHCVMMNNRAMNNLITRSHSSVTSVVRATRQVSGTLYF